MNSNGTPSTMLAAKLYGKGDLRVEEVAVPAVQKGEVKVKVAYLGICGSDLHEVYGGPLTCCPKGSPHPLTGGELPEILGHEFSGVVEELGEGVGELNVGDKVCIRPVISCGQCDNCKAGNTSLCDTRIGLIGYNRPGGMAMYVNVPIENIHTIPEDVPLDIAALAEPLAVAWHAVECSDLREGDTALILGSGPIGALISRVLKARGCSKVFISEPSPIRTEIARSCGADSVLNPIKVNVVEEVRQLTGGRGVDIAFECAGNQNALDAALESTRARGKVVVVALWEKRATIDLFGSLLARERFITASCCFVRRDMDAVLEALTQGKIKVDDLITSRILLQDIVKDGLEVLKNDSSQVKILVDIEKSVEHWRN
ncbi:2,3-butanediol dehydrogenase [Sporobolomyces salmoneus]|uniref:2,3-butanediol dehydrogenase n=1 Tax=Sporobolomyces salmoneus TaxID=183962 RepID=UPI003178CAA7